MKLEQETTRSHEKPSWGTAWLRTVRWAGRVGRAAIVVSTLWIGWSTLHALARLLDNSAETRVKPVVSLDPMPSAPQRITNAVQEDGLWFFDGCEWEICRALVDETEMVQRLRAEEEMVIPGPPAATDEQRQLMGMLKTVMPNRTVKDDRVTYCLDDSSLKVHVFARLREVDEVVVGGAIAARLADGRWSLLALRRKSSSSGANTGREGHLLPLPETARTICARGSPNGVVQLEFVRLPGHPAILVEWWRSRGWRVEPVGHVGLDWVCTDGEQAVHVWAPATERHVPFVLLRRLTQNELSVVPPDLRQRS